jgi:ABC-2 type transport system ATP-binding protein
MAESRKAPLLRPEPPAPIIQASGLTRRFGALVAVDQLDIDVFRGEVFGLLGRNGAGKSTLIKMLTTLLPPSAGTARVAGFEIRTQAADVRRVIGYVPQALSADGDLTGYENLLVFARLYDVPRRERRSRIDDALALMGLTEAAQRLVKGYSGGMIRRLEIAQSTLHRPMVLFLDEPTVGLDPVARRDVWGLIGQLRQRYGSTIVLTTHYLEEAAALCNRIGIMNRGRLVATGTVAELEASACAGATLDEVFTQYTGSGSESEPAPGVAYDATSATRRAADRTG